MPNPTKNNQKTDIATLIIIFLTYTIQFRL